MTVLCVEGLQVCRLCMLRKGENSASCFQLICPLYALPPSTAIQKYFWDDFEESCAQESPRSSFGSPP